jgi:hypothetical protein
MKAYIGTKELGAEPMTRGEYNAFRGWQLPENEQASDVGYLVRYADGYISWSPKKQFEDAYQPTNAMNFGHAVYMLQSGFAVARAGWNGKGMYVYLVPAAAYKAQTGIAKARFGEDALVPYNAYMAIRNVDGTVSTWVPSINDCLANDWSIA